MLIILGQIRLEVKVKIFVSFLSVFAVKVQLLQPTLAPCRVGRLV